MHRDTPQIIRRPQSEAYGGNVSRLPTIDEAKLRLMRLNGWAEPVAHRAMMRASQDNRMPLASVARLVLSLVG